MKRLQYLFSLPAMAVGVWLLTACGGDEDAPLSGGSVPLEVRAAIDGAATRSTVENTFETGDQIALAVGGYAPKTYVYQDGKFVAQGESFYWNSRGTAFAVAAVYPTSYSALLDSRSVTYELQPDQSTDDAFKAADMLYAYSAELTKSDDLLTFTHVPAKIRINIEKDGWTGDSKITKVTLHGLYQRKDCQSSPTDGKLTFATEPPSTTDAVAHPSATPDDGKLATFEALVIPTQTLASGTEFITVTVEGFSKGFAYTFNETESLTFEQGAAYTFNLKLTAKHEADVCEYNYPTWEEGNSGSGSITVNTN